MVSVFPSAVPFPMHTVDCPIRAVVTRAFRNRGSSTREGLRPFLIIDSLQHSSNSVWFGGFVSIVCPLPRQGRFASALPSTHFHRIVCMPSNQQQVPFFRCILICKQGLLITLHLGTYYRLYCQETDSVRATRC